MIPLSRRHGGRLWARPRWFCRSSLVERAERLPPRVRGGPRATQRSYVKGSTVVTGPSASADIVGVRVLSVHGPGEV